MMRLSRRSKELTLLLYRNPKCRNTNNNNNNKYQLRNVKLLEYNCCCMIQIMIVMIITVTLTTIPLVQADYELCSMEQGGGYCPQGNTCCRLYPLVVTNDDPNDPKNDDMNTKSGSACIPNVSGSYYGSCCYDNYEIVSKSTTTTDTDNGKKDNIRISGCGVGYTCEYNEVQGYYCQATISMTDPLVQILPRYNLCYAEMIKSSTSTGSSSSSSSTGVPDVFQLHGLRIDPPSVGDAVLPYYSSHGPIQPPPDNDNDNDTSDNNNKNDIGSELLFYSRFQQIKYVVIVIHGAVRNADDLFCTTIAATHEYVNNQNQDNNKNNNNNDDDQYRLTMENTLILSPRFSVTTDYPNDHYATLRNHNNNNNNDNDNNNNKLVGEIVMWDGSTSGRDGGPWRFGANVVWPPYAVHYSSYDFIDKMIQIIQQNIQPNQPRPPHITILGHSAGGQFVQRYTYLTPYWDSNTMMSVVANPSSYVYLMKERPISVVSSTTTTTTTNTTMEPWEEYVTTIPEFIIPTSETTTPSSSSSSSSSSTSCSYYDQWMFGLEPDDPVSNQFTIPYVQRNLLGKNNTGTTTLVQNMIQTYNERFRYRHVVYLASSEDRCNTSSAMYSHYNAHNNNNNNEPPLCSSHGLQTSCADMLQGNNRLQRHYYYYRSLQRLYNDNNNNNEKNDKNNRRETATVTSTTSTSTTNKNNNNPTTISSDTAINQFNQYRDLVHGVGHDHALVFNSQVGIQAIFNPNKYITPILETSTSAHTSTTTTTQTTSQQQQQQWIRERNKYPQQKNKMVRIFPQELPTQYYLRDHPFFQKQKQRQHDQQQQP